MGSLCLDLITHYNVCRTSPSQNKPRTPPLQWNSYQHQLNYYNQQHQQKAQYQQQLQHQLQQQIQQNQHHYERYEDIENSVNGRHKQRHHRKATSDPMAEVKSRNKNICSILRENDLGLENCQSSQIMHQHATQKISVPIDKCFST